MTGASTAQIGAIHAISKSLGMTEDERRALIATCAAGKRSSRDLTAAEAVTVVKQLKAMAGGKTGARPAIGARELSGKWAGKLRALWLSGWHLGVVQNSSDAALLVFVKRQTGLDHERFMHDAADARRVIEALKSWLARKAGVEWPADGDPYFSKRAVHRAQTRRLIACGFPLPDAPAREDMTSAELDAEISQRGAVLRKAQKKGASNGR